MTKQSYQITPDQYAKTVDFLKCLNSLNVDLRIDRNVREVLEERLTQVKERFLKQKSDELRKDIIDFLDELPN